MFNKLIAGECRIFTSMNIAIISSNKGFSYFRRQAIIWTWIIVNWTYGIHQPHSRKWILKFGQQWLTVIFSRHQRVHGAYSGLSV